MSRVPSLFAIASAFFVRDLKAAMAYRINFILTLASNIFPVVLLYLPAQLIGDLPATSRYGGYLPYAIIGSGLMNFFLSSYGIYAAAIQSERSAGTLEALLMTPTHISSIILGSTAYPFVYATMSTALYIGGGAALYGIDLQGSVPLALGIVALTTIIFVSLGVLSASYVMVWKRGDPLKPVVGSLFFLLGDVFYPIKMLPSWVQPIAEILPVTHAAAPLRQVLLEGASLHQVQGNILVLLIYVVVLFPTSLWLFSRAVRRATRDGTLLVF